MPRKLKVYQTSQGFFDLTIAAPSRAAALRAWGISQNLFQLGFAKESDEAQVIAAAMAQPGVVLKRPVGSNKHFQEHAELPTADSLSKHWPQIEAPRDTGKQSLSRKAEKKTKPKIVAASEKEQRNAAAAVEKEERKAAAAVEKEELKAAAAVEKEERKRKLQRRKERAAATRTQARRYAAIEHANSALEEARCQHVETTASIEKKRQERQRLAETEEIRWQKLRSRLEAALQKAKR